MTRYGTKGDPRCIMCNPEGTREGYCSRHVLELVNGTKPTKQPDR